MVEQAVKDGGGRTSSPAKHSDQLWMPLLVVTTAAPPPKPNLKGGRHHQASAAPRVG